MVAVTNILPISGTLENVYEFSGGTHVRKPGPTDWLDLNGKTFMAFQLYQTNSDMVTAERARFYFTNCIGLGLFDTVAPATIVGGSASWSTNLLSIPANGGGGGIQVYATWENIPFRYVRFDFDNLGETGGGGLDTGGACYAHIYVR